MPPGDSPRRDLFLLLAISMMWSSSFTVIRVAVVDVPPLTLAAGRIAIGAVALWLVLRARGLALPPWGRAWWGFALVGLLGNGLPFFLIGWGEQRITSGLAVVLMAIMPLVTLVLATVLTDDERPTPAKILGLVLGLGGVAVLVGPDALAGLGHEVLGQAAVAAAAVSYALTAVLSRKVAPAPPLVRGAAVTICAAAQMVPLALIIDRPWEAPPQGGALLAMVYLGLVPTALASVAFFRLIASRGATYMSLTNFLIPLLGVAWGVMFLDETVGPRLIGALALILGGVAVASRASRLPAPVKPGQKPGGTLISAPVRPIK